MALGLFMGPEGLDIISKDYMTLSPFLSKIAFVILLIRTGIGLTPEIIKQFLPTAFFLGIVPLFIEGLTLTLLAKSLLFESWIMAVLFSTILMCESPAIIFPMMHKMRKKRLGTNKSIPNKMMVKTLGNIIISQILILLTIDLVIGMEGESVSFLPYYLFPLNIILGISIGIFFGKILPWKKISYLEDKKSTYGATMTLIILSSVLFFSLAYFKIENILCVVFLGLFSCQHLKNKKSLIDNHLFEIWSLFEVFLFFNLGSQIKLNVFEDFPIFSKVLLILIFAHFVRQLILGLSLLKSDYTKREIVYIGFAQFPKATIQAVFGGLPLLIFTQMDKVHLFKEAEIILMAAVCSIILTAPLGAFFIEKMAHRLLQKEYDKIN
jgi:Kef-type K+ transport system membrane component KefB